MCVCACVCVWIPRQFLFGTLLPPRPACGPRKHWRDSVRADLSTMDIDNVEWFYLAQVRGKWRSAYSVQPVPRSAQRDTSVFCDVCQRTFAHQKCKNRHKCLPERRKPISEQSGSRLCNGCGRWFLSADGLACAWRALYKWCSPGTVFLSLFKLN